MKTFLLRALKYLLILPVTILFLSCESPDSDNRYESLTTGTVIGVIDKQTSEVYIFDTNKEVWFSIGRPNETTYTSADRNSPAWED